MLNERRVVVTGTGVVSCVGNNVGEFWDSVVNGRCGLGEITRFDTSAYRTHIAGEIKNFDITNYMSAKEARHMDLYTQYAVAAADEALRSAGLPANPGEARPDGDRYGVIVPSGIGGRSSDHPRSLPRFPLPYSDDDRRYRLRHSGYPLQSARTEYGSCDGVRHSLPLHR